MSWQWVDEPDLDMRIEITLRAIAEGTELTFTHARLPDEEARISHEAGWNGSLDKLERYFLQSGGE